MAHASQGRRQARPQQAGRRPPVLTGGLVRAGGCVPAPACGRGRRGGLCPGSRMAGGVRWPALVLMRLCVAGVTSPSAGGRSPRGRWPLLLRHGWVGMSSPMWRLAPGSGCREWGCPPRRVSVAPGPATGGSTRPIGRAGPGNATRPSPLSLAPRHPPSLTTHRVWRPPAARVAPAGVAAGGHREARTPASGASTPTKACRRRETASARASLQLFPAPDARR